MAVEWMTDCLFTYMFACCLSALVIGVHVIKCDRTDTCDENLLEGTFELLEDIAVSTMPLGSEAEISAVTLSIFLTYHSFPLPFRCVPHPRHPSLSTHLMKHLSLHPRLRTGSADTILRAIEELTCKNTTFLIYRARMDCDSCSEEINGNFGSKKSVSFDTKLRRHEQRRRYLHF